MSQFITSLDALEETRKLVISQAKGAQATLQKWQIILTGNVTAVMAIELAQNVSITINKLTAAKAVTGFDAYLTAQYSGISNYDAATALQSLIDALTAIQTWLSNNLPPNEYSIVNGVYVLSGPAHSPTQTSALLSLVNAALAVYG